MNEKRYTKTDLIELEMKNICRTNTEDHKNILSEIAEVKKKLDELFVTKTEFNPVRNVVYGLVGIILTAVAGAIVRLIIIN